MKRLLGLVILLLFAAGIGVYSYLAQRPVDFGTLPSLPAMPWQTRYEPLTIGGAVDGEKAAFLRDPQVQSILSSRYALTLSLRTAGSLEMVAGNADGQDFLWPSGQEALEVFRQGNRPFVREANIFNSPLVLYSWDTVVEGLERDGVVRRTDAGHYTADFPRLASYLVAERSWSEVGLPQQYGKLRLGVADPRRSASGYALAGLMAVALNEGAIVDATTVERHLPAIAKVFAAAGFLPRDGSELFTQYIQQGPSAYPLIVGYESQLVGYAAANPRQVNAIVERVRVLYPQPTVWSSHPLIALNSGAERLILALQDPEVQNLAWTRHGFRSELAGSGTAAEGTVLQSLSPLGIPATIETAVPLPGPAAVQKITGALGR